ncbi:putative Catalase isozyme A [Cocos nucifera]|uniref:Putative Catalase isozyme A n=1 Tax=Cocos nucifera TaxID=13894 RepID=A0A8K0N750_COCNU|nr:putative Catalase isozyme A [Cocos nucifera]
MPGVPAPRASVPTSSGHPASKLRSSFVCPETIRDPRGFAVKFYTREGNWDLLGNNFPVFFIRNGIKFPDVPPTSRRGEGSLCEVPPEAKPTCGVSCLLEEEAAVVGGKNHSHATQDLYESIAAGNHPEWKLYVQVMDPDHEDRCDFDPLDDTKTWPEDILPLQPVGRLVLNRNFFSENEQLAFGPGLVVPGIYYSDDKMLQCRVFAYADTQRGMRRCSFIISSFLISSWNEEIIIPKQNDFKQLGERYRSWASDRQGRFVRRWAEALGHPKGIEVRPQDKGKVKTEPDSSVGIQSHYLGYANLPGIKMFTTMPFRHCNKEETEGEK